jgi:hypothetical protein
MWGQKWWPTNLRIKILLSQWGDAACTLRCEFLFYFGSWVAFCVMTHFCFGSVCKVVVKVKKQFYSFHWHGWATWKEHYKQTFVFLSFQGGCEGPNRVFFFPLASVGHMYRVLKVNFFCFGLVWKDYLIFWESQF